METSSSRSSFFDPDYWFDPEFETASLVENSTITTSGVDVEEVLYAFNAFWATLKPVAASLVIASLVVLYIQSDKMARDNQSALKVYEMSDDDYATDDDQVEKDSNSTKLGKSFVNAIVIVCVLALVTFVLVFCYWMRCMKFLTGYMIFSSGILLGMLGGLIWYTALLRWDIPMDSYTFFSVLYNFAIVGVMAIFYQKGIPMIVTQSYLVCTSVILAWNFARFDEWTCWALLIMLAMYDLCAVLTPCGPLKMRVGLMQERDDPLPGLLYEAHLPPTGQGQRQGQSSDGGHIQIPAPTTLGVGLVGLLSLMADSDDVERQSNSRNSSVDGGSGHGLLLNGSSDSAPPAARPVVRKKKKQPKSKKSSEPSSIKLGLGDFVFYSVLVSRAAVHGFSTCIACGLVILGGLGITLVLLAVFQKALPALPVSIFLGVLFYLCTRTFIVPLLEQSSGLPIYF
jgi:presenilin 1